jgi:hypothetical protein
VSAAAAAPSTATASPCARIRAFFTA